jgi:hypothetical protein
MPAQLSADIGTSVEHENDVRQFLMLLGLVECKGSLWCLQGPRKPRMPGLKSHVASGTYRRINIADDEALAHARKRDCRRLCCTGVLCWGTPALSYLCHLLTQRTNDQQRSSGLKSKQASESEKQAGIAFAAPHLRGVTPFVLFWNLEPNTSANSLKSWFLMIWE